MSRDRRAGETTALPLLLLLVAILALGGFNYIRNARKERAGGDSGTARGFSRYSAPELEQLQDAYRSELADYERRYASGVQHRQASADHGMLAERLDEFERVQRSNEALRAVNTEVAQRQARLREIDAELVQRRSRAQGWKLHLERLIDL